MDLNTVGSLVALERREDIGAWRAGAAWLAGGTWLFSEPQPAVERLLDLTGLGWPDLALDAGGLRISATCTIAALRAFAAPPECRALDLVPACYDALQGSFKVWNTATVGGNVCLALPAASMAALAVALEGEAVIWTADGGERRLAMAAFILDIQRTALRPGEVLRAIDLPMAALRRRAVCRRASLAPLGRSAALLIGTVDAAASFALTITAALPRPTRLAFASVPTRDALAEALEAALPAGAYLSDVHGRAAWRRHVTGALAEEIRAALSGEPQ